MYTHKSGRLALEIPCFFYLGNNGRGGAMGLDIECWIRMTCLYRRERGVEGREENQRKEQ